MGHADTSVTGRYRHTIDGQLAEDARRLGQYFAGAVADEMRVSLSTYYWSRGDFEPMVGLAVQCGHSARRDVMRRRPA
jgi:hypothetical protein